MSKHRPEKISREVTSAFIEIKNQADYISVNYQSQFSQIEVRNGQMQGVYEFLKHPQHLTIEVGKKLRVTGLL